MTASAPIPQTLMHASCVAFGSAGVLILGPSGAGKSGLALQLMALGCVLVSDDQTALSVADGLLTACAPDAIRGKVEARGIGLLAADTQRAAVVRMIVDLAETETHRLPPLRYRNVQGCDVVLLHKVESAYFPAALLQYLKGGRIA